MNNKDIKLVSSGSMFDNLNISLPPNNEIILMIWEDRP